MQKIYYLLILIFSFSVLSAQEKLSKEEKARREKNIQAGNPFARFGYKAKVATLSNGKYLEFHDLDSIVSIGSVRWHADKSLIVGRIVRDTLNPDAQPIGDTAGRWMSPDPLSEEFPSYSPYNFCFNNPIKNVDPDGRAADDWRNINGQLVYDTKANGGQGAYTKNATAQDKSFGNGLRNSGAEGSKQFDALTKSEAKIKVDFQDGISPNFPGEQGHTYIDKTSIGADGQLVLKEATIEIYKAGIEDVHGKIMSGEVSSETYGMTAQQEANVKTIKDNNLSTNDMTIATFGHEIGHTQKSNVVTRLNEEKNVKNPGNLNSEFSPQRSEGKILNDLKN